MSLFSLQYSIADELPVNNIEVLKEEYDKVPSLVNEYLNLVKEEIKANNVSDFNHAIIIQDKMNATGKALADVGYHILADKMEYYLPTGAKTKVSSIVFNDVGNIIWVRLERKTRVVLPNDDSAFVNYIDFDDVGNIAKVWLGESTSIRTATGEVIQVQDCVEFNRHGKVSRIGVPDSVKSVIFERDHLFGDLHRGSMKSGHYMVTIGPRKSISIILHPQGNIILPNGEETRALQVSFNGSGQIINVWVNENTKVTIPNGLKIATNSIFYNGTGKISGIVPTESIKISLPDGVEAAVKYIGFNDNGNISMVKVQESVVAKTPDGSRIPMSSISYDAKGNINGFVPCNVKELKLPNGMLADVSYVGYNREGKINFAMLKKGKTVNLPNGTTALVEHIRFNETGKITEVKLAETKELLHQNAVLKSLKGSRLLYNNGGILVRILSPDVIYDMSSEKKK